MRPRDKCDHSLTGQRIQIAQSFQEGRGAQGRIRAVFALRYFEIEYYINAGGKLADVFISYAREDRSCIESLAQSLESAGLSTWWDRNISGGAEFSQTIERELEAATHVIVAWSSKSLASHWVRDEAELARERGKLVPLSIDGTMPPLGFRQLHALNFEKWGGDSEDPLFKELIEALGPSQQAVIDKKSVATKITKPGIAVLPFDNMSSDEEFEHIANGLTDDIVSGLSSVKHFYIPARNLTFPYKGKSADIKEVAEALDIRYLIEGSVRKLGPRMRVSAQLVVAPSGANIWSGKFDLGLDEFYENPDEIVERICGGVFGILVDAEAERSTHLSGDELGPWEYCQRCASIIGRAIGTVRSVQTSRDELKLALEADPNYALAHALFAWSLIACFINGIYEDEEADTILTEYAFHLEKAREFAEGDLLVSVYIGACENFQGTQGLAVQTLEAALKRNPAMGFAWYIICQNYAYLGRYDEARAAIERAEELAPEGGFAPAHNWYRGLVEYIANDYDAAWPIVERVALQNPEYGYVNVIAAILAKHVGKDSRARAYISVAKKHNSQLRPEKLQAMFMGQPDKDKAARDYALFVDLWG